MHYMMFTFHLNKKKLKNSFCGVFMDFDIRYSMFELEELKEIF